MGNDLATCFFTLHCFVLLIQITQFRVKDILFYVQKNNLTEKNPTLPQVTVIGRDSLIAVMQLPAFHCF